MQGLNMLACPEGKVRTLAEYEALFNRVGFGVVPACRTTLPLDPVRAVEAGGGEPTSRWPDRGRPRPHPRHPDC
jgi:hypothetical protein